MNQPAHVLYTLHAQAFLPLRNTRLRRAAAADVPPAGPPPPAQAPPAQASAHGKLSSSAQASRKQQDWEERQSETLRTKLLAAFTCLVVAGVAFKSGRAVR